MKLSEFDFSFPDALIAHEPKLPRGTSRMLVVSQTENTQSHCHSSDLIEYLNPGDVLVLNNTQVIPARLRGIALSDVAESASVKVEVLLIEALSEQAVNQSETHHLKTQDPVSEKCCWKAMVKPGKRFRLNSEIPFADGVYAKVTSITEDGMRILEFNRSSHSFMTWLEGHGETPLPPYIKRKIRPEDSANYQTVFAEIPGAVAAPTASLHLSETALQEIEKKGIELVFVTLHVGAGTFKPVDIENVEEFKMHGERFNLSEESAEQINRCKRRGGKVWAVGTTAARVLETQARALPVSIPEKSGENKLQYELVAGDGITHYFILPGYQWRVVDALLTNFHWPKSTLFMLVCSLVGIERAQGLYGEAIEKKYRLFSFGDAMLIRP